MQAKTTPAQIWDEYQRGLGYNDSLRLNETVDRCEKFFSGDQWAGVQAKHLHKVVMNFLRRDVNYFVSIIVSDDIGVALSEYHQEDGQSEYRQILDMLQDELDAVMERCKFRQLCRRTIRDAAVDGDGCIHFYFDVDRDARYMRGQTAGQISAEMVDNTSVFFADPQSDDVQTQRYILISFRRLVEDAKELAERNGQDPDLISEDGARSGVNRAEDNEHGKVTIVRKYWKQNGEVWFTDVSESAVITPPTNSGYTLYPLVWFPWERQKNRYHGKSAIDVSIPNQIFINKAYAMAMRCLENGAFPKTYVSSMLNWSNTVGEVIRVPAGMNVNDLVATNSKPVEISSQLMQFIQQTISDTQASVGASDAALGDINPTNASAIIAVQNATAFPLALQKMEFYDMVDQSVRIWLDMIPVKYGVRETAIGQPEMAYQPVTGADGLVTETVQPTGKMVKVKMLFDFSQIQNININVNVDVGAAAYWSELTQTATLSNLMAAGLPLEIGMKHTPRNQIPDKQEILDEYKEFVQAQQAQIQAAPPVA